MSDQFPHQFDPPTTHALAVAAFARRKQAYLRKKLGGSATEVDDIQFALEEAVERDRVSAYQSSHGLVFNQDSNMDYMQNAYAFPPPPQPQFYYQQVPYPTYMTHAQPPIDDFYVPYGTADFADFMDAGLLYDEFGEGQEMSTRPRLTKEQAEILEAQFQANNKPSSQVKRELAIQTNLKLTRVGNWFQNRRAKAKQQKRQEEYEAQNAAGRKESKDSTASSLSKPETASPTRSIASPSKESVTNATSTAHTSPSPVGATESSSQFNGQSSQQTMGQSKALHNQPMAKSKANMSPPGRLAHSTMMQLPLRLHGHQATSSSSTIPMWQTQHAAALPYPSPITLQDTSFDFGFDDEVLEQPSQPEHSTVDPVVEPIVDFPQDSFVITPEDWQEPLATPKGLVNHSAGPLAALPSPGLSIPSYPGSRRQSTTEDLSANFGNFALAGSSPNALAHRRASESIRPPPSGPLDIAARRKRPRPAALTSASLRSRSYGAMTSVSPTFRQSAISPQAPHTIRHVKSAGQSLHSRYAGIRKVSSAQRSPMVAPTSAETQALSELMAQHAAAARSLADVPAPLLSPDLISSMQMTEPEKNPFFAQTLDMPGHFGLHASQNLSITTASPPITPMVSDFMSRAHSQQSLAPPASAPPQYASFPEHTPPYSAGPLTNSSWSDAPLTSPEIPSFPPVTYVPSLGYPQQSDGLGGLLQQFVLPSDNKSDADFDGHIDQKKTEFYIQEFPNQREEHAHVAQQLSQQKPKNYVFANTAPQDYTGA